MRKSIAYLKANFPVWSLLFCLALGCLSVQYIGLFASWSSKYFTGFLLGMSSYLLCYFMAKSPTEHDADYDPSAIAWLLFLGISISLATVTIIWKEINYQYQIPMCDCPTDDPDQRIGAICEDGIKSYATGRGTCSDHDGVKKWQCSCD